MAGWRSLVVDSEAKLSLSENNIIFQGEEEKQIPISQIRECVIQSQKCSITIPLLSELSKNNIILIVCDEKCNPTGELINSAGSHDSAGTIMDQAMWTEERKAEVWKNIVINKIENQIELLNRLKLQVPEEMLAAAETVEPGDTGFCEAIAARAYFRALFGYDFSRESYDETNSALNYGYTIVRSSIDRILASHGYESSLGIKHKNRFNRFNLSCDIMEPFRPFVDELVFRNGKRELDKEYKLELVSILHSKIKYRNETSSMANVQDQFALDVLKSMESGNYEAAKVTYAG